MFWPYFSLVETLFDQSKQQLLQRCCYTPLIFDENKIEHRSFSEGCKIQQNIAIWVCLFKMGLFSYPHQDCCSDSYFLLSSTTFSCVQISFINYLGVFKILSTIFFDCQNCTVFENRQKCIICSIQF